MFISTHSPLGVLFIKAKISMLVVVVIMNKMYVYSAKSAILEHLSFNIPFYVKELQIRNRIEKLSSSFNFVLHLQHAEM